MLVHLCTSFALLIVGAAGAGHKANWSAVCELETARGAVEKAARTPSRTARVAAPHTPALRLSVEGGPSNDGVVPLTVAAGRVVHATYVGGGKRHLTTAISVDGKASCPGTGHRSMVAVEMSAPTTRSLRKRGHHHRHRFKRHTSHEHESKYSALRPSERVVIDAVLCDGRKKIAKQRTVTRVVEGRALGLCRSSVPSPPMPPRPQPLALLALLARKHEARSLISKAVLELSRRLERRGVLCDRSRLCSLLQCINQIVAARLRPRLNHDLRAIDATRVRWRGGAISCRSIQPVRSRCRRERTE